jgi:phosphatidylserine decarboxylase
MSITKKALITGLKVLPKNALSAAMGSLMSVELPRPLAKVAVKTFGNLAGVDFSEVKEPLDTFPNVQSFFTRALKDGLRPVDGAADAVVSPCDGAWGASGTIDGTTALQLKGRSYDIRQVLDNDHIAARFDNGTYTTLYLSPKDYHRFHMPVSGDVVGMRYVPGALWPVNGAGLQHVDGLFTKNERIIAWLRPHHNPQALVAMIAVGATVVGKIRVTFDEQTSNTGDSESISRTYEAPHKMAKGQEWGRFEFGSTIVMLATPGCWTIEAGEAGSKLRMGTRIGTML